MKKFEDMGLKEKIEAIEEIIKKDILPMLAFDGGMAEVLDVKESNSETHVYIRYGGACAACSSAGGASTTISNINMSFTITFFNI